MRFGTRFFKINSLTLRIKLEACTHKAHVSCSSGWIRFKVTILDRLRVFIIDSRQYKFKKNERIQAMFNDFDDVLSEDAMWNVSERIKPRGVRPTNNDVSN